MVKLRVPSLQHLARNWEEDPVRIKHSLVRLARNSPNFNYGPLFGAVRDMLVFSQPYQEIVKGMHRAIARHDVLTNYLSVLPLIDAHFRSVAPDYVQSVARRYYPIARGLMVPFQPPLIYGVEGQIFFPWFSFWRVNPIHQERLNLFVTMVEEVLNDDPDLEASKFQILDFAAPAPNEPRELTVTDTRDILRVSEKRKAEMLKIFAEGYFLAKKELAGAAEHGPSRESDEIVGEKDQGDLFDPNV